jgi:hypothetical protein
VLQAEQQAAAAADLAPAPGPGSGPASSQTATVGDADAPAAPQQQQEQQQHAVAAPGVPPEYPRILAHILGAGVPAPEAGAYLAALSLMGPEVRTEQEVLVGWMASGERREVLRGFVAAAARLQGGV